MGFRISMATNLRVDLKGIAYIRLTELNKRSPNITGIISWTVVPAWVKRRRQTEHKHVLLSASWLWMWCDSPPNAIVPSLPGWAVSLDLEARINLPFIKLLLSGICHSDKTKKKKKRGFYRMTQTAKMVFGGFVESLGQGCWGSSSCDPCSQGNYWVCLSWHPPGRSLDDFLQKSRLL